MNQEEEEWVGHTLIDFERKRCVSKVLSMECTNVSGKGDNYGSEMYRLKIKVVLNSGEVHEKSLVYKAMPDTEHRRKLTKQSGIFRREAKMFQEVFPEMERLIQKHEVAGEPLWPGFYGVRRQGEGLLMEDLAEIGFKMVPRMEMLNFEHSSLVMKSLGKFHALSAVLIEKGHIFSMDFSNNFFWNNTDRIAIWIKNCFTDFIKLIEQWNWNEYAAKLKRLLDKKLPSDYFEVFKFDGKKFSALIHGDCWRNNIMFKYGEDEKPINLRFVDFQISVHRSVGIDLQYFMQTSLNYDVRCNRKPELLQIYYDSLAKHLKLYGFSGQLPSFDDIMENYRAAQIYGLVVGLTTMPLTLIKKEYVVDMEQESQKFNKGENAMPSFYASVDESLKKLFEIVLSEANDNGLFD